MTVQSALNLYRQHSLHLTIPLPYRDLYEALIEKLFQDVANLRMSEVQLAILDAYDNKAFTVISFCEQPLTLRKVANAWNLIFDSGTIICSKKVKVIILKDDKFIALDRGKIRAELFHFPSLEKQDSFRIPRNSLKLPNGMQWEDLVKKLEEVGLILVKREYMETYHFTTHTITWVSELDGVFSISLEQSRRPNSNLQPIHYHLLYLYHVRCAAFED